MQNCACPENLHARVHYFSKTERICTYVGHTQKIFLGQQQPSDLCGHWIPNRKPKQESNSPSGTSHVEEFKWWGEYAHRCALWAAQMAGPSW